ncbi:hypothetical protein EDM21_13995 [Paenibacillus sp. N10]|uniref:Uncharacterized protein n=1 Tax=Paenibacillus lutrae TaxID=2078573 RepID=A0A7X3FJG0_9BACL|nr:hypothetical protein [Paenibacillus lutrae]
MSALRYGETPQDEPEFLRISFNRKYMLDALKVPDSDRVRIDKHRFLCPLKIPNLPALKGLGGSL